MPSVLISDKPYAQWLTESLAEIDRRNIGAIAVIAIDVDTRDTITGYYNSSMQDKAIMAANMQADALLDSVMANADQIIRRAEDLEDEDN